MVLQVSENDAVQLNGSSTTLAAEEDSQEMWKRTANFLEYNAEFHELEEEMGFVDPSNPPVPGYNLR